MEKDLIIERKRIIFLIISGISSLFVCATILVFWKCIDVKETKSVSIELEKPVRARHFDFNFGKSVNYSFLSKELVSWVKPMRPDIKDEVKIVLFFEKSKEKIELLPGEVVYLTFEEGSFFSKEGGFCRLESQRIEEGSIFFEGKVGEDSFTFSLPRIKFRGKVNRNFSAKWWRPNLFFQFYDLRKPKERLEFENREERYFLEVGVGDILVFKDGRWTFSEKSQGFSIAKINNIESKMEIEIWDENGDAKENITLTSQAGQPIKVRPNFLSNPHLRTKKKLSCQIEKQHFILKEGDILIHRSNGWKFINLDTLKEGFFGGDLFVLEAIDLNKKSVRGTFFDAMCTQTVKIEIPIGSASSQLERNRR